MDVSHFEDFFAENNPLISDVVVFHLRMEALLEFILKRRVPALSSKRIERMTFAAKVNELSVRGLLDDARRL